MDPRGVETVPEPDEDSSADLPTKLAHFEIVGRLGAGGMGVVFEGRDAVLGRRVALKLLHPASTVGAPARLLREAQALAKLSHPNVVTVYEVGLAGDHPFVAMELVEGMTLREWSATDHDWTMVVDLFIAVGHGLAAAHTLGLVHRDFKPSNVLLDKHGVPKLGDFGLVGGSDSVPPGLAPDDADLDLATVNTVTRPGSVMGTPAYMAPEQRRGEVVDARADQYSFAKSLREALREPFPARLLPILERAQSPDVDARYPSMAPLLDALARVRRGNRRVWIAALASFVVLAAVLASWGLGRAQTTSAASDPCPVPTDRLATVWSPARQLALDTHLQAIDPVAGHARFLTIAKTFDRNAQTWSAQHVDACRMNHVGRQSDSLLDRRMTCLDRALYELDQTVVLVERATTIAALDDATRAVVALPTLETCANVAALGEKLPPLPEPARRAEATAIAREVIELDVALRTRGTRAGIAERVTAVVARARALGDPAILSETLRVKAAMELENESAESIETLREAITGAAAAHDDREVAVLWARLIESFVRLKRAAEAVPLLPAAEAAFARANPEPDLKAVFAQIRSQVAISNGDGESALKILRETIAMLEQAGADKPDSPYARSYAEVQMHEASYTGLAGDWPRAVATLRAVMPRVEAAFGKDHPTVMRAHFNLGVSLQSMHDEVGALAEYRAAAAIGEARLAPSPGLSDILYALGGALTLNGQTDEAIRYLERAVAMSRATMPPQDPRLAGQLGTLGGAYIGAKRWEEARTVTHEQLANMEKHERTTDAAYGNGLYNLALVDFQTGHCATGLPYAKRALAVYQGIGAPDHYDADGTSNLVAECQLALGHPADAARTTAAVLAQSDVDPGFVAWAHYIHGRARTAMGDAKSGVSEVMAARAEIAVHALEEVFLTDVDAWLAAHTR